MRPRLTDRALRTEGLLGQRRSDDAQAPLQGGSLSATALQAMARASRPESPMKAAAPPPGTEYPGLERATSRIDVLHASPEGIRSLQKHVPAPNSWVTPSIAAGLFPNSDDGRRDANDVGP